LWRRTVLAPTGHLRPGYGGRGCDGLVVIVALARVPVHRLLPMSMLRDDPAASSDGFADALVAFRVAVRVRVCPARNRRSIMAAAFVVPRSLRPRDGVARLRSVPCRGDAKPGPHSHDRPPSGASFGGSTPSLV
jgi:hypothetical protein